MTKTGRSKNKKFTDSEIQSFCQSVEKLLNKISDRPRIKATKGKSKIRKAS
jgi:ElaB/YqjD/DUF883 family membrane-anchored ribosome-binding protein